LALLGIINYLQMFYFLVCAIPICIQFVGNLELLVPLEKVYVNENVLVSISACTCVHPWRKSEEALCL